MRFCTAVGEEGKPPACARQWRNPLFSKPSSQTGHSVSIPVWEKKSSTTGSQNHAKPEWARGVASSSIHSTTSKSAPFRVRPQMHYTRLPLQNAPRRSPDETPNRNRSFGRLYRKSLPQRLLGLFMALCIAVGLLACVMDRLGTEFDKIEWELEKSNEMTLAKKEAHANLFSHSSTIPSERRARRLAATAVDTSNGRRFARHERRGFFNNLKFQVDTILRLVKYLNRGSEYATTVALVNTLYKLSETSILPTMNNGGHKSKLTTTFEKVSSSSSGVSPAQPRHALLHNDPRHTAISLKPLHSELLQTKIATRSIHIPKAAWTGSIFSKTVSGTPTSYNLFSSKNDYTLQNQGENTVAHVNYGQGNMPGINSAQNSLVQEQKEFIPSAAEAHEQHQTGLHFAQQSVSLPNTQHPVEAIVVWELPRGRSLCRIFNVARLSDGSLFLPKWMEKHKETLVSQCGLKNPLFDYKGQSKDQWLKDYSLGKTRVDGTFADRDLFSPYTPRHHMPHFLSDIIPPLVATEVMLGSGREVVPFRCITEGQTGCDPLSTNLIYTVKPFLFLDKETISKPPSHWVPSLARFFANPKIGFDLVPDFVSENGLESNQPNSLSLLRSVVVTNINPYEPYGLFGADGKNHVFTYNGISREPTWTSEGMLKRPCIVSVTVLTRKGHRALLQLEELQKVIKARFTEQGLDLDFNVVDFNGVCFEDQVQMMQKTNVLIASHGAGNTNIVFMKPGGTVIEVFPFSYKAGPFDGFAKVFGMEYKTAMSAPQTNVFKACMRRKEKSSAIMKEVFDKWDRAVEEDKATPWIHRLDFEKEFGEPGKSEGMTTRICARQQQLKFNIHAVAQMALDSGLGQCHFSQTILEQK